MWVCLCLFGCCVWVLCFFFGNVVVFFPTGSKRGKHEHGVDVYLFAPNHAVQRSFNTGFPSTLKMRRALETPYEAWKDPMMGWCAQNLFCSHCMAVFFFTESFPALTLLSISWSVYDISCLSDTYCFEKHQKIMGQIFLISFTLHVTIIFFHFGLDVHRYTALATE